MLRSIKQLYGAKLGSAEGEVGQVTDFYFDDQNWAIRYLVVDTGAWLPGREVLVSPHSVGPIPASGHLLLVNLTRKQMEHCPPTDAHKPVSRQYEEEYYRHFGWPNYWQGGGLWGASGLPTLQMPVKAPTRPRAQVPSSEVPKSDSHLRSTLAVTGYQFKTTDAIIGHVGDFMVDCESWAVTHLLVRTGHRLSGKEVLIATANVERISYEESTVFAGLTGEAVEQSPAHSLVPDGVGN
ncbi:MAG: PRC-barrel domain containing protein [Verrucomicrobiales bacterium]|nr:PRC-barrel domain containing protein [Verrucomicrobiales bacterium]